MPEKLGGLGVTPKIPAFVCRIAPGPFGIPVPGGNLELGVLSITYRPPARGETLLDHRLGVEFVDGAVRQDVNRAAEGAMGTERIRGVASRRIHANGRHAGGVGADSRGNGLAAGRRNGQRVVKSHRQRHGARGRAQEFPTRNSFRCIFAHLLPPGRSEPNWNGTEAY